MKNQIHMKCIQFATISRSFKVAKCDVVLFTPVAVMQKKKRTLEMTSMQKKPTN